MKHLLILTAALVFPSSDLFATTKTIPAETIDQVQPGTQDGAEFGRQSAVVGDVNGDGFADLLVGAPLQNSAVVDGGAAFLYAGTATGFSTTPIWQVIAQQSNGQYGSSVAGIGDVNGDGFFDFAVGAQFVDNGSTDEGGVYIYFGGTTISTTSTAFLEVNQGSAFLGGSLAGAGDINGDGYSDVIAGAAGFDTTAQNGGLAGVWFGGPGTSFDTVRDVSFQSGQADARLGTSVASAGDFNGDGFDDVIIGAADYDDGSTNEGAAFLFLGGASVNTVTDGHFQINQAEADFGRSVAGIGDVNGDGFADLLVGAPEWDDGDTNEGGAFVYFGGATVNTASDFTATSNQADAQSGLRVAGLGDIDGDGYADIAIASPLFDGAAADTGLVQVFRGSASGINVADVRSFLGDQANEEFGIALSGGDLDNDGFADLVAGAPKRDIGIDMNIGQVSIARGAGRVPDSVHELQFESNAVTANLGNAMATGDLNGDGHADLAVGAFQHSGTANGAGLVYLFLGSSTGLPAAPNHSLSTNLAAAQFGASLAIGDLNGDGFGDLIVGAPGESNGQGAEGRVHVYFGGQGSFETTVDRTFEVNQGGADFGRSVAFAGDVNGDGLGDLMVGAPLYDLPLTNEGAAFLFFGGGVLDTSPDLTLDSNQGSGFVGVSVAGIGDLNGDGYADVAAGANGFDVLQGNDGAAFVWFGGARMDNVVDRTYSGDQLDGRMGVSIAGVGDVNADGYDDFVVGAGEQDVGGQDSGAAFLFLGAANPLTSRHATLSSQQAGALDGTSVAAAGDVNQDGFADLWVGATGWDNAGGNANQAGAAFLYLGGPGTFNAVIDLTVSRTVAFHALGKSMASGDFDGDGDADFATGIWLYQSGETNEGAIQIFRNGNNGRNMAMQTFSDVLQAPVEQWGKSHDPDGFTVAATASSPFGGERARIQIESCPVARPFGDASCRRANGVNWIDVSPFSGPVTLTARIGGLNQGSLQHWRARIQYAPLTSGNNGTTRPLGPRSGPWRRMTAEPMLGDIRITSTLFKDDFE